MKEFSKKIILITMSACLIIASGQLYWYWLEGTNPFISKIIFALLTFLCLWLIYALLNYNNWKWKWLVIALLLIGCYCSIKWHYDAYLHLMEEVNKEYLG